MTRARRTPIMSRPFLFVLVGLLVLTGCADRAAWTALERLPEPLTFDNALAADQGLEDEYWAIMQDELGIVLSDETRTDRYGTWHPLTLASDAPVLDIDPDVIPADLDPAWTAQGVQTAWQAMAEFLVNEQLDSELVWDDTPENRSLLAERAGQGVLWRQDPQGLDYFMDASTSYEMWLGPRFFDQDNVEWRESGGRMGTEYLPARPATYELDRPRTLISSLALDSVAQGDDPGETSMTAEVSYCRPIRVETTGDRRYECRDWHVVLTMAMVAGEFDVVEIHTGWWYIGSGQMAALSEGTRRRLPLLETTPASDDWSTQEIGGLVLGLPPSAALDTDDSCGRSSPEEDQGEAFVLDEDSSGDARCLRVLTWDSPADGPAAKMVGSNETVWYAQAPRLAGTATIGTYLEHGDNPAFDIIDFLLTDGPGAGYRITAEVPSGTGEQFARQLLSTFDASAVPAPSPT